MNNILLRNTDSGLTVLGVGVYITKHNLLSSITIQRFFLLFTVKLCKRRLYTGGNHTLH